MNKLAEILRRNVTHFRSLRGLKCEEAAEMAGMFASQWSKYEKSGSVSPSIETLERIAAVLGVEPSQLLRDQTTDPTEAEIERCLSYLAKRVAKGVSGKNTPK